MSKYNIKRSCNFKGIKIVRSLQEVLLIEVSDNSDGHLYLK